MRTKPAQIYIPTLEERAQVVYEPEALERCGDPDRARHLAAMRYWVETRRPGADGHRVLVPPEREIPLCKP